MKEPTEGARLSCQERLGPCDFSGIGRTPTRKDIQAYGVILGRPTRAKVVESRGDQPY